MFSRSLLLSLIAVTVVGCPRPLDDEPDAGDTGPELQVCSDVSECDGFDATAATPNVRCDGVCLFICNGVDEACPRSDMFCDQNGTCAFGCRDSGACNVAGQRCVNGQCSDSAAECTSKCDCDPGQVCRNESCVPAGNTCDSGDDCPRGPRTPTDQCTAFQCNGFTDQCFDPNPELRRCTAASECVGRPGCLNGTQCTCTAGGACVPAVACTAQTEQQDCGFGNFCDNSNACAPLPTCPQGASDCSGFGLVCNTGTGQCERSQPCTQSTDCVIAPNTHCSNQFCTIPNCLNGGQQCATGQTCNAQGRCTQGGSGAACTSDNVCPATEYCDLGTQSCTVGCRNNASCPSGQTCNGNRQCVNPGGGSGGQFGSPCVADDECSSPMICGLLTGTCAEPCASASDCIACNAVNGACRCVSFIGSFCQP